MMEMTSDASEQLKNGVLKIATEPEVSKRTYGGAALMVQEKFKAFKAKSTKTNTAIYSIPSNECASENATENYYKTLVKATWKSFDEFIVHGYQKFHITIFSLNKTGRRSQSVHVRSFSKIICANMW